MDYDYTAAVVVVVRVTRISGNVFIIDYRVFEFVAIARYEHKRHCIVGLR